MSSAKKRVAPLRMVVAAMLLPALGLAEPAVAAAPSAVAHVLTVAGAPNSVASWRVLKPLTLGDLLSEPSQRLAGGDGEFATVVIRDAKHRIVWAQIAGNVPGRDEMVRVPIGGEGRLQPGTYSVALLSQRPQSLRLRVPGLLRDTTLRTQAHTVDRTVVLAFGTLPATGVWVDRLMIDPTTVHVAQLTGSSGIGGGPGSGNSLCALPPSTNLCAQPDEFGSRHDQTFSCVAVTCPVAMANSHYTWRNYRGSTIPGRSLLSQQDEDGVNPSWHAVVAITSSQPSLFGYPSP